MMYHVVKCDDCGFTMTVPWNVAADQHAKAHGWFIYPPQARCPKCGMPTMDGRKRPGRVYAFSCNEARTLFRELYLALCAAPPE